MSAHMSLSHVDVGQAALATEVNRGLPMLVVLVAHAWRLELSWGCEVKLCASL